MEEFDESYLNSLIEEALSNKETNTHPFGSSAGYLGFAETDLLQFLYERLSKRFVGSYLEDIFQDVRTDILSRKVSVKLKDLHTITKNCKKCEIDSSAELPKWNVENPDIVVVAESPNFSPEAVNLMVNSFKKVGLTSQQLCLTYVNRCPVRRKYESSEIINCSPYLHTELQILNPKLIISMGSLSSSVLFGTEMKLKELHGEILWLGYWPIMITYSPNYVIKQSSLNTESNFAVEQYENDLLQAYNFISKTTGKETE